LFFEAEPEILFTRETPDRRIPRVCSPRSCKKKPVL